MLKAFAVALVMSSAQPVMDKAEGAKAPTVNDNIIVVQEPAGRKRPRNTL